MRKKGLAAVRWILLTIGLGSMALLTFGQPKTVEEPVLVEIGQRGGQVFLTLPEPESFNPITTWSPSNPWIPLTHAGLLEVNPVTGHLEPALAKSFEVSDDRRSLTFFLREGLKFWDGHALTAEDVLFMYKEILFNPETQIPGLELELPVDFQILDETTIVMTVATEELPAFPNILQVFFTMPILPQHKLAEAVAQGRFNEAWPLTTPLEQITGAGPFKLARYVPGRELVLERNPHYWKVDPQGQHLPYLDRVVIKLAANREEELAMLERGETELLALKAEETFDLQLPQGFQLIVDGPEYTFDFLALNLDVPDPPLKQVFREKLFRQAVSQGIDRRQIIAEALQGLGEPWFGTVNRLSPFYEPDIPRYDFNPEAARAKLEALGLMDTDGDGIRDLVPGKSLEFELIANEDNPIRVAAAEVIRERLKQIGIEVNVRTVPFVELREQLLTGQFQAALVGTTHLSDPFLNERFYRSGFFWHPSGAEEPFEYERRIDQLLDEAFFVFNFDRRKALASELQRIMAEELPIIPLWSRKAILAAHKELGNVETFTANASTPQVLLTVIFRRSR